MLPTVALWKMIEVVHDNLFFVAIFVLPLGVLVFSSAYYSGGYAEVIVKRLWERWD